MRQNPFAQLLALMLMSLFTFAALAQASSVNWDDPKMTVPAADHVEATGDPAIPIQSDGSYCITCARKDLVSGCGANRAYSDSYCKELNSIVDGTATPAKNNGVVH